jgi:hypothetical protein
MRKNIDFGNFQSLLINTFPPIKLGVGYGSAFFQQKSYDYKAEVVNSFQLKKPIDASYGSYFRS